MIQTPKPMVLSILGRHGSKRIELVKVRGKPCLMYVPDRPPAPPSSGDSLESPVHVGGRPMSAICSIAGCADLAIAKGLCSKHWKRAWKGQDPAIPSRFEMTEEQRFWSKVQRRGEDECWLWQGSKKGRNGIEYGSAWFRGRNDLAHRVAWTLIRGPIPEVPGADYRGTCLLHSCDNPLCVNPGHLTPGTHLQNMQDKVAKGRDTGHKTHCKRGHPRTPENIYVSKEGLRACKLCQQIRREEKLQEQKGESRC